MRYGSHTFQSFVQRTTRLVLISLTLIFLHGCAITPRDNGVDSRADAEHDWLFDDNGSAVKKVRKPRDVSAKPALSKDLWERMRSQFTLPEIEHPRISNNLEWYSSRPDFIARTTDRAEPYLYLIVNEIERRGLPLELALLPVVESAFQPMAFSTSRAAGIWQFIPSTGTHFGLKQNHWYDGRRDIVDSTRAAMDYFEVLEKHFDGDWLLAIAAYNAGEGTVLRAMEKNRRLGRPTDFWSLDLPEQTLDYVPRLLAISYLVADPARYQVKLRPIANQPYLTKVNTGSPINLAVAADIADMPLEELYRLNPGFNRGMMDPDGPNRLLLPVDRKELFQEKLSNLSEEDRLKWQTHIVQRGDTLSGIARRHGVSLAMLREANNLHTGSLSTGSALLIPSSGGNFTNPLATNAQVLASGSKPNSKAAKTSTHTVKAGENLWAIARQHGVSVKELSAWNGLSSNAGLKIGQHLKLKSSSKIASNKSASEATVKHYTVQRGDSLHKISRKFKVSVSDLSRWNNISNPRDLKPGQRIKIYTQVAALDY